MQEPECYIASTAALLHDISLMGFNFDAELEDQQEVYRQHPLHSASIVDAIVGINPKVAMAVAQVHEEVGPNGFPRGLSPSRIMPIAKIINLADTYITLTSRAQPAMFPPAKRFHPADAIGYIMYHAALGRFEVNTVRALVRASSLYPIGSTVELMDESTAVVFRSTRIAPSKPIVQLDSSKSLLDLRSSNINIRGPWRADTQFNLLRKSQLSEVFWG
jgi:HD-GYP domain-containing protein (c-di-GMP phosphodiesterase class II)